jgi:ABC-type oligopeptide transport system substrate-binding subunit
MGYYVPISMYHDPIELLDRFKYADNPRNYSHWEDPAFTALLNQAGKASTEEEYIQLLDQAEELLIQEMPFAPIFHWNYALLVQPHVKGFAVSPLGYLYFDRISIEI